MIIFECSSITNELHSFLSKAKRIINFMKKSFFYCLILSFLIWLLPFLIRIVLGNISYEQINNVSSPLQSETSVSIVDKIAHLIKKENRSDVFLLIFKNNIKGCTINIAGGMLLGLGTVVNLSINGFYSSDVFIVSYYSGQTIKQILHVTLPHSFELIGFWLSGAIGLHLAWNIILFIRGKESFTSLFYKKVGMWTAITFLIILAAAFVEAYVSINI